MCCVYLSEQQPSHRRSDPDIDRLLRVLYSKSNDRYRTCRSLHQFVRQYRLCWRHTRSRLLLTSAIHTVSHKSDFLFSSDDAGSHTNFSQSFWLRTSAWQEKRHTAKSLSRHLWEKMSQFIEDSAVITVGETRTAVFDFDPADLFELDTGKRATLLPQLVLPPYCGYLFALSLTIDAGMCPRALATRYRTQCVFDLLPHLRRLRLIQEADGPTDRPLQVPQTMLCLPQLTHVALYDIHLTAYDLLALAAHATLERITLCSVLPAKAHGQRDGVRFTDPLPDFSSSTDDAAADGTVQQRMVRDDDDQYPNDSFREPQKATQVQQQKEREKLVRSTVDGERLVEYRLTFCRYVED